LRFLLRGSHDALYTFCTLADETLDTFLQVRRR